MASPTQLSMMHARALGGIPDVVERWTGPVKQDLFGAFDLIVMYPNECRIVAVQTTAGMNNKAARRRKMDDNPLIEAWLRSGGQVQLHGWRKMGARGKRKLWVCSITEFRLGGVRIESEFNPSSHRAAAS